MNIKHNYFLIGVLVGVLIAYFSIPIVSSISGKVSRNTVSSLVVRDSPDGANNAAHQPRPETWSDHVKSVEAASEKNAAELFAKMAEEQAKAPPIFSLMTSRGQLTTGAAEAAKLTPAEREACEKILKSSWAKASNDFASRAVFDRESSNETEGLFVYQIQASPDRGASALNELKSSLETSLGKDKLDALTKGISDDDFILQSRSKDTRLEFDQKTGVYRYEYINPTTGKSGGSSGSAVLSEFHNQFGDSFDLSALQH